MNRPVHPTRRIAEDDEHPSKRLLRRHLDGVVRRLPTIEIDAFQLPWRSRTRVRRATRNRSVNEHRQRRNVRDLERSVGSDL